MEEIAVLKFSRWMMPIMLSITMVGSACSTPKSTGRGSETADSEVTTIRLVTGHPDSQAMDAIIAAFMDKYPNYRVTRTEVGSGEAAVSSLTAALDKGEADVISSMWLVPKSLQPLESYIAQSRFDLKPFGPGLDVLRFDGQLFDLPVSVMGYSVYFNKGQFAGAGLQAPRTGWTWDEFRTAAMSLTKKSEGQTAPGFASSMGFFLVDAWVSEEAGRPYWEADDSVVKEGLQFFETLVRTDRSVGSSADASSVFTGATALGVAGVQGTSPTKGGVGFGPMPTLPGHRAVLEVEPWTYAIASNSENPAAAWDFLRFAAGEEGAVAAARAGTIPMYNNDAVRAAFKERKLADVDSLYDSTWLINPNRTPGIPYACLRNAAMNVLAGRQSADEAFEAYKKALVGFRTSHKS